MADPRTVRDLLGIGGATTPALLAPERPTLSYRALCDQVDRTVAELNRLGVGRGDVVAIVLPNGPAMATAFLGAAAGSVAAPLNPAYKGDEFDFYLGDLGAKALIIDAGSTSPAITVARARGIPLVELIEVATDPAGVFGLEGRPSGSAAAPGPGVPDDMALVLHTSGTTSRPKMVPLLQSNLVASAQAIGRALALGPDDRCLNIMPLFHIHGLIGGLLAPLAAGGSVAVTEGFNALRFFGWLDGFAPTWYSAVPTMHQAILARAARNRDVIARRRLRLIRSSSASLPPPVMAELEATFDAPVIESYGMTEATHQMASNPLPPRPRKPGTVGIAAGPEIAIMDGDGRILPQGEKGEVVIRGPGVTKGYANNPDANAKAFTDGWFRTGDEGWLDGDGYLTISGRLKEIINRGGEKIAPREIDDVLLAHPAVAQALAFAMPHKTLGEDVAAAVVLREGVAATEAELRAFAGERLAPFKVPRRIVLLDAIPKGATGKLQRIGLAAKLGLAGGT
ncbi:MAG: AMP-dependent synthetase [Alphaproteobacteria bacterium]|nr:AMP-dependent synthetase [Alphaproteobacteria bacterium]